MTFIFEETTTKTKDFFVVVAPLCILRLVKEISIYFSFFDIYKTNKTNSFCNRSRNSCNFTF